MALWTFLKPLIQRCKRRKQNPNCHLLGLPIELLLLIVEQVPIHSQLVFLQTCLSLRALPHTCPKPLCSGEYLEYLTLLGRDKPDKWVCELCYKLHPIRLRDIPPTFAHASCPDREAKTFTSGRPTLWPAHRHVQLALKYTRRAGLSRREKEYLQRLLAPQYGMFPTDPDSYLSIRPAHTKYEAQPKIVGGRYLLKMMWHFTEVDYQSQTLCQGSKSGLTICRHQKLPPIPITEKLHRLVVWQQYLESGGTAPLDTTVLEKAIETAFERTGVELHGSCPYCPADFSIFIQSDNGHATVSGWWDLGPEVSSADVYWQIHKCGLSPHFDAASAVTQVYRAAGSVRELYEHGRDIDQTRE